MLATMLSGLTTLFERFQAERHQRDDRMDEALTAIYAASCETKLYLTDLAQKKKRSRARERELARLWARSAAPVRRFDRDLADRCLRKSELWIRPDRWTGKMVQEQRIGIEQVFEDARQLLLKR